MHERPATPGRPGKAGGRRGMPVALYDGGAVLVAILVAIGFAIVALGLAQALPEADRRVVVVERPVPPGHRHIPPGQLKKAVRVVRVVTFTPALATRYGVRYRQGVVVIELKVVEASPPVGLVERDVIIGVNGHPVRDEREFAKLLRRYEKDGWVEVVVLRSGRLVPVRVDVDAFDVDA